MSFFNWLFALFRRNNQVTTEEAIMKPGKSTTKRALLVGINKYAAPGCNLSGCVNDVWDMYELLTKDFGFNPDNVRVVVDERATFKNILERLQWLIKSSEAGDEAVYYHSGHGSQVRDRNGDELSDKLDECVSGSTLITTDVGLVRADRIHNYLLNGGVAKAKIGNNFYPITNTKKTQKEDIVRVCCRSGIVLEFSKNHKVTTFDNGFMKEKYAKDLTTEDILLASSSFWKGKCKADSFWYLIGLFIGDGHFQSNRSIRFGVRKDIEDWKSIAKLAKDDLNISDITESYNCRGDYILRIGDDELCSVLRGLGFKGGVKKTGCMKDIPIPMNESCWKGLLRGLFDSEGCSTEKSISFGSTDYLLAKLVNIGLRWFGINSSMSKRPRKGKANTSWNVNIWGENVLKFDSCIGFGFKAKQKERLKSCGKYYKKGKMKLPDVISFLKKWNLRFFDFYSALEISNLGKTKDKYFHKEHIQKIVSYLHGVSDSAKSISGQKDLHKECRLSLGASIENIQNVVGTNKWTAYSRMENDDFSDMQKYSDSLSKEAENLAMRDWSILENYDLMTIDSIEQDNGVFDFYDFTVQEVERFEADGMLVHNCLITHDHDWDDPFIDDILHSTFKKFDKKAFLTVIVDTCLSKDTLIPLLDGTQKTIKELTEEKGEYWVYSSLPNGQVVPGKAHSARITGKRKLIKVNLDNGKFIECTDNHLFMMRDGTYKEAGKLKPMDSLMPLYRKEGLSSSSKSYMNGYECVHTTNPESGRRIWTPTHHIVRDYFKLKTSSEKSICHHKNFNKKDNTPENLEMMSWRDYKKMHGEVGARNLKEGEIHKIRLRERNHIRWHVKRNIIKDDCEFCCPNNHKVVSVEDTGRTEYVYDLTVDKHHNFALSSGVFVHNCHSGTMTRGLVPGNHGVPADEEYCKEKFIVPPLDILTRSLDRDLDRKTFGSKSGNQEKQRHVLLSGCKENETSKELRLGNSIRGALTYNLTKFIRANPDKNWKAAHRFVLEQVKKMQHPQLRGLNALKDRKVFGGKSSK